MNETISYEGMAFLCLTCEKTHPLGECEFEGLCRFCKKRSATIHFGDMLSFTHGGGLNCCERCALEKQLEHARERAAMVAELEARLAELEEAEYDDAT